ncbi:MAG TPA: hypothetical protein VGU74_15890, partial [Gemmatimonadales bacterium]|nr:hypothetical protein [Gemmatimonadales bacterium]
AHTEPRFDRKNQTKSPKNVALHFRENATPHQAKSMTYATSTRANCRVEEWRGSLGHAATPRFHSPLIEPDGPSYGIRLVWGFLCQGCITPFLSRVVTPFFLLFDPRREHSSIPTAHCRRRRAQRRSRRRFFSAAEGLFLTDASTAAGCP